MYGIAAHRVALRESAEANEVGALGKLFESFYRTDKARSQTAKGSGLGLAIARGIVEGMGGTIHAETTAGSGLTVVVAFPVLQREEREEGKEDVG